MDRRLFPGGIEAAAISPRFPTRAAPPAPIRRQLLVDTRRKGRKIGQHRRRFEPTGAARLDAFHHDERPAWAGLRFKGPVGSAFTCGRA